MAWSPTAVDRARRHRGRRPAAALITGAAAAVLNALMVAAVAATAAGAVSRVGVTAPFGRRVLQQDAVSMSVPAAPPSPSAMLGQLLRRVAAHAHGDEGERLLDKAIDAVSLIRGAACQQERLPVADA
eukprot:365810-Chlamydomonas_euryale.AAC.23